jgi:hypothetical protein
MEPKRITRAALAALDKCPEQFTCSNFIRHPDVGPIAWSNLQQDGHILETGKRDRWGNTIHRKGRAATSTA